MVDTRAVLEIRGDFCHSQKDALPALGSRFSTLPMRSPRRLGCRLLDGRALEVHRESLLAEEAAASQAQGHGGARCSLQLVRHFVE